MQHAAYDKSILCIDLDNDGCRSNFHRLLQRACPWAELLNRSPEQWVFIDGIFILAGLRMNQIDFKSYLSTNQRG